MYLRIHAKALIVMMTIGLGSMASIPENAWKEKKHIEVSMRLIGHQVLLSVGDSSSIVLPVQKNGDLYKIRFGTEFGFDPEIISPIIDSVIRGSEISDNYIVEFVSCLSNEVVHSYEIGEADNLLACQGRAQPTACYELWITLMDEDVSDAEIVTDPGKRMEKDSRMSAGLLFTLMVFISLLIALVIFLRKRRKTASVNPDLVMIGEFEFNKKNMELQFKDEKIELTGKEADLLDLLCTSVNSTVEREDILRKVWGDEGDYVGRTLDVFVSKLRKKLEPDATVRIVNIRGVGYKLVMRN